MLPPKIKIVKKAINTYIIATCTYVCNINASYPHENIFCLLFLLLKSWVHDLPLACSCYTFPPPFQVDKYRNWWSFALRLWHDLTLYVVHSIHSSVLVNKKIHSLQFFHLHFNHSFWPFSLTIYSSVQPLKVNNQSSCCIQDSTFYFTLPPLPSPSSSSSPWLFFSWVQNDYLNASFTFLTIHK